MGVIKEIVVKTKERFVRVVMHFHHRMHLTAECTYLSAVAVEAHGFYAIAALILLVVTVIGVIVHVGE